MELWPISCFTCGKIIARQQLRVERLMNAPWNEWDTDSQSKYLDHFPPLAEPCSMISIEEIMTMVGFHRVCCRTRVLALVHVCELAQGQVAVRDPELTPMRIFRKQQSNPQPPRVFVLSKPTMQNS